MEMPRKKKSQVVSVNVVDEMKQAYGDYALAVIVGRAIPSLYDGFKPAQRRILTAMKWLNLKPDSKFMKCARVTGETMGKLHPQGGCYGTLVGMTQWWTNNNILINGHGNFGSPTDGPAAERYTECKLTEFTWEGLLQNSDVWETRPSYDGSFKEPIELNVKVPQVLLNGSEGIAVGFATKIPTHNLRGVSKALRCLVEGDTKNGAKYLIPDFPTGCEVVKDEGLLDYLRTGSGSFRMRAVCEVTDVEYGKRAKRKCLTFTNLPLHVDTEQLGEQVKNGLAKGNITTVADVRDETDMTGVRFVVILKANMDVERAKAELYRFTSLDSPFSANNLVIDGVKPIQLAPYDILSRWLSWRDETLIRIFTSELGTRRERLEVVKGLITALDMIDDVIDTIKQSKDKADARVNLIKRDFTERQANAILDMRLSQLTKLDDKSLRDEAKDLQKRIKELIKYNSSKDLRTEYILDEVDEIATRFGNTRRSKVIDPPAMVEVERVGRAKTNLHNGPRPRYLTVDESKGIITQEKKVTRKTWIVDHEDRIICICDNGLFLKVNPHHKGPLFGKPTKILYKTTLSKLPESPLLLVFKLDEHVYANSLSWEALTKCTSKGKRFLPEGAELMHLGGPFTITKNKGRNRQVDLNPLEIKQRPVGGKGSKIIKLSELT